ncbi:MAG: redox-sensing transcriptional repressor Rex [Verrucomicrobia bacterium]|nr:redox-sensing transcriptional repressor Rex [Verrucomicrobiota bacterium]
MKKTLKGEIPRQAVYRLSVYMRCLMRLKANGLETVSSQALSSAAGVKPTQLRKDLTYFGQFGTRGLGYDVNQLTEMIAEVLGTNTLQPVVLIGVGNLGKALISYKGFEREGFEIVSAFDANPGVVALGKFMEIPVRPMDEIPKVLSEHQVRMAILCVPVEAAQSIVNVLIENGVTGILNFAPIVLLTPEGVTVNNVNLAIELENLSYFIQEHAPSSDETSDSDPTDGD